MSNKNDIPLILLKAIEPIAQKNLDLIKVKKEDNTFYSFIENNPNSNNCFKIYIDGSKKIGQFNTKNFGFGYKPADETRASAEVTQGNIEYLKAKFESWIQLIREINETNSIHDDNFTKYYSDYYFNEFEIIEEDANIFPFAPDQQLIIENYLISLTSAINISLENVDDISKNEIITEINDINFQLSSNTKNQVMKKITTVFGKLFKLSKPFAEEIVKETRNQLIGKLIEFGIKYGPTLLENLK